MRAKGGSSRVAARLIPLPPGGSVREAAMNGNLLAGRARTSSRSCSKKPERLLDEA